MQKSQTDFLNLLFDPGQRTCFAPDAYGTTVKASPEPTDIFFSINALSASRADANVTCYRNFLLELDTLPLNQQIEAVTSKIPVSSITYSGGKSYHFIISLREPLQDETEYRRVWRGLHEAVPQADKTTKNPSRLSRLPGVLRPDTSLMQELVYLGNRIALAELPKPSPYHTSEKPESANVVFVTQQLNEALQQGVDNFIEGKFGGRNQFFYWLGRRLSELGHTREQKKLTVDKFYSRLSNKRNFSIREAYMAARVKY